MVDVMKIKLAVVVTHPIQHFAPVYQFLAGEGNVEIVVYYLTDAGASAYYDTQFKRSLAWDLNLLEGYRHFVLNPGRGSVPKGFIDTDGPGVSKFLDDENPDAVLIYGYTRLVNFRVWLWAKLNDRKLLYCSDSVLHRKRSSWKLWIKKILLPWFFRGIDTFLVAGDCNAKYFSHYGVSEEKILICPLPVDVRRLRRGGDSDLLALRYSKRAELGIRPADFVVMFCGKMYEGKRPFDLLNAVKVLRESGLPVVGLFVGSGALLERLQSEAKPLEDANGIFFSGFVNQQELPSYYLASDLLAITSSEDAHPLVATEAAVFGLPLVVSNEVGCLGPRDVAQEGVNAFSYRCGDVSELARRIEALVSNPDLHRKMSASSTEISRTQDVSAAAKVIEGVLLDIPR